MRGQFSGRSSSQPDLPHRSRKFKRTFNNVGIAIPTMIVVGAVVAGVSAGGTMTMMMMMEGDDPSTSVPEAVAQPEPVVETVLVVTTQPEPVVTTLPEIEALPEPVVTTQPEPVATTLPAQSGPANQCNEVEIYDPAIAAQGVPGANGNTVDGQPLQGSGNGCVPVCVWFDRYGGEVVYSGQLNLNRALSINQGNPGGVWLFKTPTSVFNPYVYGYSIDINPSDSESQGAKFLPTIVEVKVDAGQQSCSGYDAQGNVVALTPYQARQQGLYG